MVTFMAFTKSNQEKLMWQRLAGFVLKFRLWLLALLFVGTGIMAFFASKVELSYEFTGAIPRDNPKWLQYQSFKKQFGKTGI